MTGRYRVGVWDGKLFSSAKVKKSPFVPRVPLLRQPHRALLFQAACAQSRSNLERLWLTDVRCRYQTT